MDHEAIQSQLWLLNDPELPAEERRLLVEHLGACAGCSQQAAKWALAQQAFAAAKTEPSDFFVQQTMERVRRLPAERFAVRLPSWLTLPRWSPLLGAGLASAAICVVLLRSVGAVSTETLLLAGMPESESWMFGATDDDPSILLGITAE